MTYDDHLMELQARIAGGRIADRRDVARTHDLALFAQELSGSIRMWDDRDRDPSWRPDDPAVLARRLGTPETRRGSRPATFEIHD